MIKTSNCDTASGYAKIFPNYHVPVPASITNGGGENAPRNRALSVGSEKGKIFGIEISLLIRSVSYLRTIIATGCSFKFSGFV